MYSVSADQVFLKIMHLMSTNLIETEDINTEQKQIEITKLQRSNMSLWNAGSTLGTCIGRFNFFEKLCS